LAFIVLLMIGVLIGYFVGVHQEESTLESMADTTDFYMPSEDSAPKNKPKDKPLVVNLEPDDSLLMNAELDSLEEWGDLNDTLSVEIELRDTSEDEELHIKRDRLISTRRVPIIYLDETVEKDSVIKDLLGIKEHRPTEMILQFWESPLGYSGYKLSRNTLILYGLSEQFKYKIYFKDNAHYLATKDLFYILKETSDFVSFKSANRSQVLDD